MPAELRAAVIGCGRIGSTFALEARAPGVHSHAQAYATHPRYRLAGVCDADAAKREAAAKAWDVPAFSDPVAACKEAHADVVSVCTPDETHFDVASRILRESPPRVLFIEKPVALRSSDARALLELAHDARTSVAVNFVRRYSPAFRTIRDELASGALGRPVLLRILYGKGLFHNGSHAIDLARAWLGEPTRAKGGFAGPGPEGDPTYDADIEFASGARAKLEAFDEGLATVFEGDLLTARARVRFWMGGSKWEFSEIREGATYAGYRNFVPTERARHDPHFTSPLQACFEIALSEIADHISLGSPLACTGLDGLAAIEWAERIRGQS